ncbi:ATP-NAD kinase-like domain-containing protein, partial [Phlyctochytrium arcticum]
QHVLKWSQAPRTVLIVKKVDDPRSHTPFIDVARWLQREYPSLNIVVEPEIASEFRNLVPNLQVIPKGKANEYSRAIDYVITLGGDGTILHASSVFPHAVPPFISFSLGTLGFLLPFEFSDYSIALRKLMNGHVPLLLRMRLKCEIYGKDGQKMPIKGRSDDFQAMNDITLHRGRNSHLTVIDCSVEGEFLTDAVADGLIVSTPTGSTAYSLSAGGPIVHPAVQSILITPICPRSLSFRPALLPSNVKIRLQLSKRSRGTAELTVDGQDIHILGREEFVEVQVSRFPIPCVSRTYNGGDWVKDINQTLKWNQRFATRLEDD